MSKRGPMKRLHALRLLEEEREETELRKQRQLRQACLDALHASEIRKAMASRDLHHALDCGDRGEAISAEMALACGPMQRRILQARLVQLEETIERATATWQVSRVCRLQMEAVVEAAETALKKETIAREQKALDGWFLSSRARAAFLVAEGTHESFQRECALPQADDGMGCATGAQE